MYILKYNNKIIMKSKKLKPTLTCAYRIIKTFKEVYYTRTFFTNEHTLYIDYGSHTRFFIIENPTINLIEEYQQLTKEPKNDK